MNLVSPTPQTFIATASKPLVDELLSMNTHNRTPKKAHIDRLSLDMVRNKFFLTASGIGVSKDGVLLDGQNRLYAIRQAGYPPVKFVLTVGLDAESQRVVDRHSRRRLSDALSMHMNITISTQMVSLANSLHHFGSTRQPPQKFVAGNQTLTDTALADFMAEYGDLAAEVIQAIGPTRASVSSAVFVYALHDHKKAIDFAREVSKGADISADHPAYRLRAAITRLKRATDTAGRLELFKLSANACMAHSDNRFIKHLKGADSWEGSKWSWAISGADIFAESEATA
jgi:hypothetical protein